MSVNFDCSLVFLYLLPFNFLMEQPYCLQLDVVMFCTVHFYVSWSGFLYFMGLFTFCISALGFIVCQIAIVRLLVWWCISKYSVSVSWSVKCHLFNWGGCMMSNGKYYVNCRWWIGEEVFEDYSKPDTSTLQLSAFQHRFRQQGC